MWAPLYLSCQLCDALFRDPINIVPDLLISSPSGVSIDTFTFSVIVRNRKTWVKIKGAVFISVGQNRQWAPGSGTWWRQISAHSPARMFSSDFPPAASSLTRPEYVAQHFWARLLLDILHPEQAASPWSCPGWCQCLLRVTVSANGSFSPSVDAKFLALWVIVACYHLQPHPRPELCGVNSDAEWRVNIYTWAPCRNNNGGRGVIGRQTSGSWLTLLQSADKLSKYIHHHHPPPRWLTISSTKYLDLA